MRIPTDSEIDAAARELGVAVDGKCPRSKRAQVAKAIQIADAETRVEQQHTTDMDAAVEVVAAFYQKLRERTNWEAAARITAALAPTLYRNATAPKDNKQ